MNLCILAPAGPNADLCKDVGFQEMRRAATGYRKTKLVGLCLLAPGVPVHVHLCWGMGFQEMSRAATVTWENKNNGCVTSGTCRAVGALGLLVQGHIFPCISGHRVLSHGARRRMEPRISLCTRKWDLPWGSGTMRSLQEMGIGSDDL